MAELLEVPILKRGVHNGFAVNDLHAAVSDTMKALPLLLESMQTGIYRGNNERFNTGPIPGFINLNHDGIAPQKMKEWSDGVSMELDTRLYDGEEWVVGNFRNVNPELAQLLATGFPGRSVEILPEFHNADTGEIYPAVIRSVAFLDAKTDPAVPQYPGYSVKLAKDELGVQVVLCQAPKTKQPQKETIMPDKEDGTTVVKLSQEDIQRFDAMEQRLKALETEKETLKGALNMKQADVEKLAADVVKFQAQARESSIDAYCSKLEKEYNLTPVAIEAIRPVLQADNGVVKMSSDAEPITTEVAYMQSIEAVLKLARDKDALFVPAPVSIPAGKQDVKKLSAFEAQEAEIKKLQAENPALTYADARLSVIKMSNSILDIIEQARHDEGGN